MECVVDTTKLKKKIENERVYDFLVDLNPSSDKIIVQILRQDPLPTLHGAYMPMFSMMIFIKVLHFQVSHKIV